MWRCGCLAVLIVTLGVEPTSAADREKPEGASVVPKVVRTIPIPNNKEPGWSTRRVDIPTVHDPQAGSDLVQAAAVEPKSASLPAQAADMNDAAALSPPVPTAHNDLLNVLAVMGAALISLAVGLAVYGYRTRPPRPDTKRSEPPPLINSPPLWLAERNGDNADADVPSVEVFGQEIRKMAATQAALAKPVAFDPYA